MSEDPLHRNHPKTQPHDRETSGTMKQETEKLEGVSSKRWLVLGSVLASRVFISTGRRNISDSRRDRLGEMGAEKHFSTRNVDSFTLWNRRRTLPELPSTSSVKISARTRSCPILRTCDRDPHTLVPPRRGGASLGSLQ